MSALYNLPRDQRLNAVRKWVGKYVTVMHAPLRAQTSHLVKHVGKCVCPAVLQHGTTSDVIIIHKPGQYPIGISLAQVYSIGPLS